MSAREVQNLFKLLNDPNLASLPASVSVTGAVTLTLLGPGLMDRVVVALQPGITYDLLQFAPASWLVQSPSLEDAVRRGQLTIHTTSAVFIPQESLAQEYPLPVGYTNQSGRSLRPAAEDHVHQRLDEQTLVMEYAPTVEIDFNVALPSIRDLTLLGNVTFTTASLRTGRAVALRLIASGGTRNLTFPGGWKFLSSAPPASLASGKTAILSITAFGTTDADVIAAYAVEA